LRESLDYATAKEYDVSELNRQLVMYEAHISRILKELNLLRSKSC